MIWIIASNLVTLTIKEAYDKDIKEVDDDARDQVDFSPIQKKLRDVFSSAWGVSSIYP
jgi:hypothetical protein